MKDTPNIKSRIYTVAVIAAGLSLWVGGAVGTILEYTWPDQLFILAIVPLIVITGLFPNTFPLPAGLKLTGEKLSFTLSDALTLLVACWFGLAPCIFVAGIEGYTSSRRTIRRLSSNLFSSGMMSLAAAAAATCLGVVLSYFGAADGNYDRAFHPVVAATLAASVVHIIVNTGLISVLFALRLGCPVLACWKHNFIWAAPMFLPTSGAASLMYITLQYNAVTMVAIGAPILIAIHIGNRRYRDSVREQLDLMERAQRERDEAARERAEQAERHVAELERANRALEESREHFRHAAYHDALTGLPNRVLLTDHLRLAIERAKRHREHSFGLIFLDLDRFKYINDSLGHAAGDQLLVGIARRLETALRPTDTVARLGGDEFAILLDGLEDDGDAIRLAERVQTDLSAPFTLNGHEVFTTASVGITLSTTGYDHPEDVLRDADTAMYRAKENGKARYELFDAVMHARAVERLRLENDLRRAVERGAFQVYYQPIISLETDKVAGFEALVRWQHPERGFVPPSEFIPIAEETGLIVEIGQWVLAESCRQMREWQRQSFENRLLTISVNLSGKQFLQPNLISRIKQTLHETDLDPRCLKLEITESIMMENAEAASEMLVQLRALGVQLSIDDFGTGYSSLSYLHRFPVNTLKIDRSFITRMGADGENAEIVRTIMTLASNLGMEVIAEGVETKAQLAQLKSMGCLYGQGYLFSQPLNKVGAGALIRAEEEGRPQLAGWTEPARLDDVEQIGSALLM
jgi:diguanylate cyclase (GGDEF)-like protein